MSITLQCSAIAPQDHEDDKSPVDLLHFIPAKIKTESSEPINIANFFNNYTVEVDNGIFAEPYL